MYRRFCGVVAFALALCLCIIAQDTVSIMDDRGRGSAWATEAVTLNSENFQDSNFLSAILRALDK